MKGIILLILFLALSTSSYGQFRFGAKVSLGFNNLTNLSDDALSLPMYTFSGGLTANYTFTKIFSLQSELILNTLGKNFTKYSSYVNFYGDPIQTDETIKIRLHYLEIPLLAKFTIFGNQKVNFNVLAGAFAGYRLSAKQKIGDDAFQNVANDYTNFNAGYSLGFGLSCMKQRLFFELRGNRGLVNINASDGAKINTIQGQYTVGYFLFSGKKK